MKVIELTKGFEAYVDDADAELAMAHKWYASVGNSGAHVYAVTARRKGGGRLYLHHLVMGKPEKGYVVDHINGDTLDNRRENLRFATYSENTRNNHARVKSKAGYRGVQPQGNSFIARVARDGVRTYLGAYSSAEAAAAAIEAFDKTARKGEETVPALVARIAELEAELASYRSAA